jgi:rubrerythrin
MSDLKGTKTHENLKEAFAGESQANRRYLYFAQKADVEGYPDVAALFRSVAEGETGHAFGHFDHLSAVGDPVTGVAVGETTDNLKSAIEGETYEYTEMYPGFARTARDEGFDEIGQWFETLARAEKSHAGRFSKGLEEVS